MDEPLKKHGNKLDLGRLGGPAEQAERHTDGDSEPQTTPLEPEAQGEVGGP